MIRWTTRRALLRLLAIVTTVGGCSISQRIYTVDGKTYGVVSGAFRGRWYNYYQRALSYMEGGYWDDAVADLEAAIELRGVDQRRARTYGLHFIDYFPHRELGICLLHKGDVHGAVAALEASLESVDSGRAEYYYNVARRDRLRAQGVVDEEPPAFEFPGLTHSIQRQSGFRVVGSIKDPSFVASVSLNGEPLLVPLAVSTYEIDVPLALKPGSNDITLRATDLFGNSSDFRATVTLDPEPPVLSIGDFREVSGVPMVFGTLTDASEVVALRCNGEAQGLTGADRGTMEFQIPVEAETLEIEAEDSAGNKVAITIDPRELGERLAEESTGPPHISVQAVPDVVFTDRIFVDGTVWDAGGISKLTVGGEEVATFQRRTVYFRRVVPLNEGTNEVLLEATDVRGVTTRKTLRINRRVPPLQRVENRLSVAMAPFLPQGEASAAVEQNLENALVEQKRFHVLDRSRIAALVTEWELVASDLTEDGPDLLELGQQLGSDVTMMGWIKENNDSIEVYGRLVDSDTGSILLEKDVFHEKKSLRNVKDLLAGLALKLKVGLPVLEGVVARLDGDELRVTMPDARLLPPGARLLVVQVPEGKEQEKVLGEARIESIHGEELEAKMYDGVAVKNAAVVTK